MITIIGAGPAGCYSAYLLAKNGEKVELYEEHPVIGKPVACTGIITGINADFFTPPAEIIVNRIAFARIYAPNGRHVEVRLKNDLILDRAMLDQHLAGLAEAAGATIYTDHRFIGVEQGHKLKVTIFDKNAQKNKEVETDILVGADGPLSRVAKASGMYGDRTFYAGMQVTADIANEGYIEFYPIGKDIAWLVPENKSRARIGVAASEHADRVFAKFMERRVGRDYDHLIIEQQAGLIPIYDSSLKTVRNNIYLVGDAATTVKAPTLGGINQSMIGAVCLAKAISEHKDYEKLWKKAMGRDLILSLYMRKIMNRFSEADYNDLVGLFQKEKNKKLLEQYERDAPSKFAFKLLLREPKLALMARRLVK